MLDRAAIYLKVGDQPKERGEQHLAIKEGMVGEVIVEKEWGKTLEEIIAPDTRRVFGVVEINPKMVPFYKECLEEENPDDLIKSPANYRKRKRVIPLPILAERMESSDLVDKLRGRDQVPLIDGRSLVERDFQDSKLATLPENVIRDLNVITSGTHNIGSGETYTTVNAWELDIGTLTGDMTGQLTSDTTETTSPTWDTNLATNKLRLTSSVPNLGDPTAGYKINFNHNTIGLYPRLLTTSGIFEMDCFRTLRLGSGSDDIRTLTTDSAVTLKLHDLLIDGAGASTFSYKSRSAAAVHHLWNMLAWGSAAIGFYAEAAHASTVWENCGAYSCASQGFWDSSIAFTKRNHVSFSNGTDFLLTGHTKCASSDGTGSEVGLQNLTPANEVDSLDDTNSNFFKNTLGANLDGTGTLSILAANNAGNRGNARPNGLGLVSIGLTEALIAAGGGKLIDGGLVKDGLINGRLIS